MHFLLFAQASAGQSSGNPAAAAGLGIAGCLMFAVLGLIGLLFYFLPAFIAVVRKHQNMAAIIILNVALGWTLLGWVAALVWSFTNASPTTVEVHNYGNRSRRRARDDEDDDD